MELPKINNYSVIFMMGGPGSGKSCLVSTIKSNLENTGRSYVHIDPDEIKLQLPEYQELKQKNDPNAAGRVHDESIRKALALFKTALSFPNQDLIIFEGTGSWAPYLKFLIRTAYEAKRKIDLCRGGYRIVQDEMCK